jgi:hypothetical protein
MFFDLLSLGNFWFGKVFVHGEWTAPMQSIRTEPWPPFVQEARSYQNLLPTRFILEGYISIRHLLHNSAPLGDFLCLKLLRFVGFLTYFAGGIIILGFFAAEGARRNKEKRINFEQISSTAYHFGLKSAALFTGSVVSFFVFVPSKLFIPFVIETEIPSLIYNPFIWSTVVTIFMSYLVYILASNFSTNV